MHATATTSRPLANIAEIRMGYSVRTRGANFKAGPVRVVQARSLEAGPRINLIDTDYTEPGDIDPAHFLRDNDIVFRTRGSRFEAAEYKGDGIATVAAAPLVLVRLRHEGVTPEYVAWFVNHDPAVRRKLERSAVGKTVPTLKIGHIASIEVPVPPLDVQVKLVAAGKLITRQQEILRRLQELVAIQGNVVLGQAARRWSKE